MKKTILSLIAFLATTSAFASNYYLTIGSSQNLNADDSSCGGSVKVTESANGENTQVNVVFSHVKFCSNFDIIKANGEKVANYDNKKIPGENQDRSASFTLPKKVLGEGFNNVKILIRSDRGAHADTINVIFNNPNDPTPPSSPSSGNW